MSPRAIHRNRGSQLALRLLASEEAPALPDGGRLIAPPVRRPGELHEVVTLSPAASEALARQRAGVDLEPEVAGSLLVEAATLERQLAGLEVAEPRRLLGRAADGARVACRTRAAEADYLRGLTSSLRRGGAASGTSAFAVPVRLLARIEEGGLERLLAAVPLSVAVAYEVAALAVGRTMTEWGLGAALAVSAAR